MTQYNEVHHTIQSTKNNERLPVGEQIIIIVASLFLIALGFGLGIAFATM